MIREDLRTPQNVDVDINAWRELFSDSTLWGSVAHLRVFSRINRVAIRLYRPVTAADGTHRFVPFEHSEIIDESDLERAPILHIAWVNLESSRIPNESESPDYGSNHYERIEFGSAPASSASTISTHDSNDDTDKQLQLALAASLKPVERAPTRPTVPWGTVLSTTQLMNSFGIVFHAQISSMAAQNNNFFDAVGTDKNTFIQKVLEQYHTGGASIRNLINSMIQADNHANINAWAVAFSGAMGREHIQVYSYLYNARISLFTHNDGRFTPEGDPVDENLDDQLNTQLYLYQHELNGIWHYARIELVQSNMRQNASATTGPQTGMPTNGARTYFGAEARSHF